MKTQNSTAINVARAHIDAWSHHDWDRTRKLLAPDVHAWVTSTQAGFGTAELTGIDAYMEPKIKAAQLIEPGSVHEICAIGDEHNVLILVTFRIGLGPGATMVTMARSCLYLLDENEKIANRRPNGEAVQPEFLAYRPQGLLIGPGAAAGALLQAGQQLGGHQRAQPVTGGLPRPRAPLHRAP